MQRALLDFTAGGEDAGEGDGIEAETIAVRIQAADGGNIGEVEERAEGGEGEEVGKGEAVPIAAFAGDGAEELRQRF